MKTSKRRLDVLSELPTDNNTATTSNYNSVVQVSSLHTRIQNLEASLQMSLRNQKMLNENLQFMLQVQQKLRYQLEQKDRKIKQLQQYVSTSEQKLLDQTNSLEQFKDLLIDSQNMIKATQQKLNEKQLLLSRKQTTIKQQKKVIQSLQNQKLYTHLNGFDSFVKQEKDDLVYQLKQSYQKKINQLQYQLKRLQHNTHTEKAKAEKSEKQLNQFKKWLCELVGVEKIVAGCEKMIMGEISKRLRTSN